MTPEQVKNARAVADGFVAELRGRGFPERTAIVAMVIMDFVAGDDPFFLTRIGSWLSQAIEETIAETAAAESDSEKPKAKA